MTKGFDSSWYKTRAIFGSVLVLLSLFDLFLYQTQSNFLFFVYGLVGGGVLGSLCAFYYKKNPHLQKELPVKKKVSVSLLYLALIFLNISVFKGFQSEDIAKLIIFGFSFFGSFFAAWGLLGKK